MKAQIRPALVSFLALTALTGIAYPLLITAIAQVAFPWRANGSVIERDGNACGSSLVGQPFSDPKYFRGRPSATSPVPSSPFNADKLTGSTGSNQGPTNPALFDAVKARVEEIRKADPTSPGLVPIDLVTASGSGLDPDISLAGAEVQVARVARARGISEAEVRRLVASHTVGQLGGILGEPVVRVLELNLALDKSVGGSAPR